MKHLTLELTEPRYILGEDRIVCEAVSDAGTFSCRIHRDTLRDSFNIELKHTDVKGSAIDGVRANRERIKNLVEKKIVSGGFESDRSILIKPSDVPNPERIRYRFG